VIQVAQSFGAVSGLDDDGDLDQRGDGHQASIGDLDGFDEGTPFGFPLQDGSGGVVASGGRRAESVTTQHAGDDHVGAVKAPSSDREQPCVQVHVQMMTHEALAVPFTASIAARAGPAS
jgi:hypothetical protein